MSMMSSTSQRTPGSAAPTENSEGSFEWSNGELWVDIAWGSGQPDNLNGNQHCVVMRDIGGDGNDDWDDLACDADRDFLCERAP